jgi:hypothetical protein
VVVGKCYSDVLDLSYPNGSDFTMTKGEFSTLMVVVDMVGIVVFLFMVHWLRNRESVETLQFDARAISCSDYTVYFSRLPPHSDTDTLKRDLINHLNHALNTKAARALTKDMRAHRHRHGHSWRRHSSKSRRGGGGGGGGGDDDDDDDTLVQVQAIHFGFNDGDLLAAQRVHFALQNRVLQAQTRLTNANDLSATVKSRGAGMRDRLKLARSNSMTGRNNPLSGHGHETEEERELRRKRLKQLAREVKYAKYEQKRAERVLKQYRSKLVECDGRLIKMCHALDTDKTRDGVQLHATSAFVTFTTEEGYIRCRRRFPAHAFAQFLPDYLSVVLFASGGGGCFGNSHNTKDLLMSGTAATAAAAAAAAGGGAEGGAPCEPARSKSSKTRGGGTARKARKVVRKTNRMYQLYAREAADPGIVIWQNLDVSPAERLVRSVFTHGVAAVILVASFAVIYATTTYAQAMERQFPQV